MEANRDDRIAMAVEAIGRNAERMLKRRSPFHLQPCGGCGAPSFQQPCSLCGYYPMGTYKGTWHPKEATAEQFAQMVERSGPGGKDGTIATWHARETMRHHPERCEEAAIAVMGTAVSTVTDVWEAVAVEGRRFTREWGARHVMLGWEGMAELTRVVSGDYGRGASPRLASEMSEVMDRWIEAVHANNAEDMATTIEQGLAVGRSAERTGNLVAAMRHLDEALTNLQTQPPRP